MSKPVHLEPEAAAFAAATANPPYLFDLGPARGRAAVDEVQSSPIDRPDADLREIRVPAAEGALLLATATLRAALRT